jgi:hypothetical protein
LTRSSRIKAAHGGRNDGMGEAIEKEFLALEQELEKFKAMGKV